MTDPVSNKDTIIALERKVWDALVTGDCDADNALLASDFLGVYPDGFAGKADHVAQLQNGPTVSSYLLTDFRFRMLAGDMALLAYRTDFKRVLHDVDHAMFVTSIWQRCETGWENIFSQDTVA